MTETPIISTPLASGLDAIHAASGQPVLSRARSRKDLPAPIAEALSALTTGRRLRMRDGAALSLDKEWLSSLPKVEPGTPWKEIKPSLVVLYDRDRTRPALLISKKKLAIACLPQDAETPQERVRIWPDIFMLGSERGLPDAGQVERIDNTLRAAAAGLPTRLDVEMSGRGLTPWFVDIPLLYPSREDALRIRSTIEGLLAFSSSLYPDLPGQLYREITGTRRQTADFIKDPILLQCRQIEPDGSLSGFSMASLGYSKSGKVGNALGELIAEVLEAEEIPLRLMIAQQSFRPVVHSVLQMDHQISNSAFDVGLRHGDRIHAALEALF